MPHLTSLQKKFEKQGLTVIGVSTDSPNSVGKVEPYVADMGDKMDYTVAIDKDGATSKAYMDAFGVRGIPHAFIIDQHGKIAWHGHPMANFDEVVAEVARGDFDLAAARKLMAKRDEQRREAMRLQKDVTEYFQLVRSSDDEKKVAEVGLKILTAAGDNVTLLNGFAWEILTGDGIVTRDLKLALASAEKANQLTKGEDASILDTYALALFENDKKKEAVEVQTKAVKLAREDGNAQMIKELEGRLERFQGKTE